MRKDDGHCLEFLIHRHRSSFYLLEPGRQHPGHLIHAVAGTVFGQIRETMPVRIIEINNVDARDAGLVERDVIVVDPRTFLNLERIAALSRGDSPELFNQGGRIEP